MPLQLLVSGGEGRSGGVGRGGESRSERLSEQSSWYCLARLGAEHAFLAV